MRSKLWSKPYSIITALTYLKIIYWSPNSNQNKNTVLDLKLKEQTMLCQQAWNQITLSFKVVGQIRLPTETIQFHSIFIIRGVHQQCPNNSFRLKLEEELKTCQELALNTHFQKREEYSFLIIKNLNCYRNTQLHQCKLKNI